MRQSRFARERMAILREAGERPTIEAPRRRRRMDEGGTGDRDLGATDESAARRSIRACNDEPAFPNVTARDAAVWGLSVPARCATAPRGAIEGNGGGRLNLTVVRKNRADQHPMATGLQSRPQPKSRRFFRNEF